MSSPTGAGAVAEPPTFSSKLAIAAEALFVLLRMLFTYVQAVFTLFYPPKERSVSGEIVLITGTGHGIGKELACMYGELGATVVCVDVNQDSNNATVDQLKKTGSRAHGYTCDVSSRDAILSLRDRVKSEVGQVTILINNAGIMPCKPFSEQTPEVIKKQFDINVFAHFWTLEAFLPAMVAAGSGHVVALSSVAGLTGNPNLVPYCATKFAVRGMMEALCEEHRRTGSPIKFTTIYPYMTDTGLCKNPRVRFADAFKMLTPAQTAAAIVSAQRRGLQEASVPRYMLHLNNTIRSMPRAAAYAFVDFLDAGLDPHD